MHGKIALSMDAQRAIVNELGGSLEIRSGYPS
jgi:hypothetical protein